MTPTTTQRRTLLALLSGGTLRAFRLYSTSPHEYLLKTAATDEKPAKESKLGLATVSSLVVNGWLKPHPEPPFWDNITYEVTPAGQRAAEEQAA